MSNERADGLESVLDFGQLPGGGPPASMFRLSPEAAAEAERTLFKHPDFRAAALERGSSAAQVRTLLAARQAGNSLTREQVEYLASGVTHTDGFELPGKQPPAPPSHAAAQASALLDRRLADADWVEKSMQRGTPEAAERLRLNAAAAGSTLGVEESTRLATAALESRS